MQNTADYPMSTTILNCPTCSSTAGVNSCPLHGPHYQGIAPRREPYRCPSCNGYGRRIPANPLPLTDPSESCRSCDGTGILWS